METEENSSSSGWDNSMTRLLIATRLKYENEFKEGRIKKALIWNAILNEMQEINPNVKSSTFELTKKFNNLIVTYKRIKNRSRNSGGRITTSWEHFDSFDAVYRDTLSPRFSQVCTDAVECSPLVGFEYWNQLDEEEPLPIPTEVVHVNVPLLKQEYSEDSNKSNIRSNISNAGPSTAAIKSPTKKSIKNVIGVKKDRAKDNILNYLKNYDAKVEKRHRQTLKIELKKIKIEEEKLKILAEIRDILRERR